MQQVERTNRPVLAAVLAVAFVIVGVSAVGFGLYINALSGSPGLDDYARSVGQEPRDLRAVLSVVVQFHFVAGVANVAVAVGLLRARTWAFWLAIALLIPNSQAFPLAFPPTFPAFLSFSFAGLLFAILASYFLLRPRMRSYLGVKSRRQRLAEGDPTLQSR